ncbi:MAG: Holliday junction branch migration protein RuvA [Anaerolineae bacterium]
MIERIAGTVAKVGKDFIVVMVGGIGVQIRAPRTVLDIAANVGTEVLLYTHVIFREDEIMLYGFASEDERAVFEILIGVSGVGAKTAIAMLSTLTTDQMRAAVRRSEAEILTRVPGIGKKTAEKIIFELKDKLGTSAEALAELAELADTDGEVIAALTSMGFSIVEAQSALQRIPRDAPQDIESRIMLALQNLG